jgi:hypothetical protein
MSFHPAGGIADAGVPAPPPGPGVAPPFAAPPSDKSRRGLWIGLGVGGLVLLLFCAVGLFGIGVLVVGATDQAKREATQVVTSYLNALQAGRYDRAHAYYCDRLAREVTRVELAAEARREPFTDFRLDDPRIANGVEVAAHLTTSGGEVTKTFYLETAGQELQICAIR